MCRLVETVPTVPTRNGCRVDPLHGHNVWLVAHLSKAGPAFDFFFGCAPWFNRFTHLRGRQLKCPGFNVGSGCYPAAQSASNNQVRMHTHAEVKIGNSIKAFGRGAADKMAHMDSSLVDALAQLCPKPPLGRALFCVSLKHRSAYDLLSVGPKVMSKASRSHQKLREG